MLGASWGRAGGELPVSYRRAGGELPSLRASGASELVRICRADARGCHGARSFIRKAAPVGTASETGRGEWEGCSSEIAAGDGLT